MDKKRFEIIGNAYICMTLNAETATEKVEAYLKGKRRSLSAAQKEDMVALKKWIGSAEIGQYLIRNDFTVRVIDSEVLRKLARKREAELRKARKSNRMSA